jgi:hypothetical protein
VQQPGLRYYSSELGRWVNRDPIGEFGGLCLYGFLEHRVLGSYDYLGMIPPAKAVELITWLMDCKDSTQLGWEWDAAVEYVLKRAYGKKWKKKLVKLAGGANSSLGAVKYVPKKYEEATDIIEKLYPNGVPFDTKGLLDADLSKIVSGLGHVQNALDAAAIILEGSEEMTAAGAASMLSKIFDLSTSLTSGTPGVSAFINYYSEAIKAIAVGIKGIEDTGFEKQATYMMGGDCDCIHLTSDGFHGVMRGVVDELFKD